MSKELEGEGDSEDDKKHTRSPRHRAFLDFSVVKSVRTDSQTVRRMKTRGKVRTYVCVYCVFIYKGILII